MSDWLGDLTDDCEVCGKTKGKYRCPKCGVVYCSVDCFRAHNEACTTKFGNELLQKFAKRKVSDEMKLNMRKTLQYNDVDFVVQDEIEPWKAWWESKIVDAPHPLCDPPERVSPLLPCHLTNILYGYCYTMRLYNGDSSDFESVAGAMLEISAVLSTKTGFKSVRAALKDCIESTKNSDLFVEYQWQVEVVHDVELCLQTRNHVFKALSESLAIQRESKHKNSEKKLLFFFAWSQTLTPEILASIRNEVHEYYTSLMSLLVDVLKL